MEPHLDASCLQPCTATDCEGGAVLRPDPRLLRRVWTWTRCRTCAGWGWIDTRRGGTSTVIPAAQRPTTLE